MMEAMNFDMIVPREGTYSEKYDALLEKFGREDLIPLWVADMDFGVAEEIWESLMRRVNHPIYGYTQYPERYFKAVERWITKKYKWPIRREWLAPLNSIVPAMNLAVEGLSDPGDAILIQPPVYPPFYGAIRKQKRRLLENELVLKEGRYEIDFIDFEAKAKEAKLFLFCSPHNPTGRVWRREELERIAEICRQNGVIIVSDEVHADLIFKGHTHIPIGSIESAKDITITLNAPSKSFNIAGIVNAYTVIPNDSLRRRYLDIFRRFGLIQANPFGVEATIAAYERGEVWLYALREYLSQNRRWLLERFDSMPKLKALENEATFLLWIDCREMEMGDEALAKWFVEKAGLALNPGISFGRGGEGFMRLNFATSREVLEEAMERLERAYREI